MGDLQYWTTAVVVGLFLAGFLYLGLLVALALEDE